MTDYLVKQLAPQRRGERMINAMSVDVEEYFHAQALDISLDRRASLQSRVEGQTERILALFGEAGIRATFFVLGSVGQRTPGLIRRIVDAGHELACHGWDHQRADSQTIDEFRNDVRRSKATIEDLGGMPVRGYRAATFSIGSGNSWAFRVLKEEGYAYSSSVFPIKHDYYGLPNAPRFAFFPDGPAGIEEYPLSSVRIGRRNLPCAGGGYFRLLPYAVTRAAIRRLNRKEGRACIFYFHPWEIDPGQPRISPLPWKSRFRHYTNLAATQDRLKRLLDDFAWDRIDHTLLTQDAT